MKQNLSAGHFTHPREMTNIQLKVIAELVGISWGHMLLGAKYGYKKLSPQVSQKIERVTGGRIKKWMLRPDIWAPPPEYIFPEVKRYNKRRKDNHS